MIAFRNDARRTLREYFGDIRVPVMIRPLQGKKQVSRPQRPRIDRPARHNAARIARQTEGLRDIPQRQLHSGPCSNMAAAGLPAGQSQARWLTLPVLLIPK